MMTPGGIELPDLPVCEALPALREVLHRRSSAVLVAPPGAGKTTLVPLDLLGAPWIGQGRRILLLEPRRLAARAAARRMASLLGEEPGGTVGYAMRMESRVSQRTRILVVTEGVLARMIIDDPELSGIAVIVFDEFHERSLDGDFGLALAMDVQAALRPELRILVMSATIDGARVAQCLDDAPVVESAGRSFPVDIRHEERPADMRIEEAMARAVRRMLAQESGSILAFLPGLREIERTADLVAADAPADLDIAPLHGGLDGKAQDAAIRPAPHGRRKLVLATSIAETSITIEGVRVVIDSGLARLPRFEPATGLTRLETVRASRASADQRAGRAGRTQPGVALRLWRAEQTAALPAFTPPEILAADLSALLLDCAAFGVAQPESLRFLDPPPAPALAEARALLLALHALDEAGRITPAGKAMRDLSLPVRLAHMVSIAAGQGAARQAADLAILLTERGLGGTSIDLDQRLSRFRGEKGPRAQASRALSERLARQAGTGAGSGAAHLSSGALLSLAYPDRIARARGDYGRFVLANGRGAVVDAADRLAGADWLVVADLQGKAQNARIAAAAQIDEQDVRDLHGDRIATETEISFDRERASLRARRIERLGAIVLAQHPLPSPGRDEADAALVAALRAHGLALLPWSKGAQSLRRRLAWLHKGLGAPWPQMDDASLLATLEDWLAPFMAGQPTLQALEGRPLVDALMSRVPYDLQHALDTLAPTHFAAPSGSHVPIRYEEEEPVLSIRVQELFGMDTHPAIAGGTVPLTLELLSPAHRPIQTTRDLPGFWRGSWADVRAQMRGRYPRHSWPEDPSKAQATARAKPRGT